MVGISIAGAQLFEISSGMHIIKFPESKENGRLGGPMCCLGEKKTNFVAHQEN